MIYRVLLIFFLLNNASASEFLVVQSTTSTSDSGFYEFLLPKYEEKFGVDVRVVAVGTGQAIKNAMNGDGDLLIVHSEDDEKEFIKKGYGLERKLLMYNDFIIIGPKKDQKKLKKKKL
jgi:tungstate transport system substrate-binding protein